MEESTQDEFAEAAQDTEESDSEDGPEPVTRSWESTEPGSGDATEESETEPDSGADEQGENSGEASAGSDNEPDAGSGSSSALSEEDREELAGEWLGKVRAAIEAAKRYPPRARRSGVEGGVTVELRVTRSGAVAEMVVEGDQEVLKQAAERAVREAEPLPKVPAELSAPRTVRVPLRFTLRGN